MRFSNTYAQLSHEFFVRSAPLPVEEPRLFLWNSSLSESLGVSGVVPNDAAALALMFSGNRTPAGSEPIALAYAGHQFGRFVPQLGDGRAHLLGEVVDSDGVRRDIQLKGSGPTSFSRGGDGRCALGPAIREFVMSEAMHALGVPTTRCLAVVTSGEDVIRETYLPGAIVTRIASSHLRVGTFEYFAARQNHAALKTLANYAIDRHYPDLRGCDDRYARFLDAVIDKQIALIVDWMRVGFIHGVMNTDNTAISGETIDYGPCAMMSRYDPKTVYSSIDVRGRYAFGNQPNIAAWNVARLAECLVPLIDADEKKAAEDVTERLQSFSGRFQTAWLKMMGRKLGFENLPETEAELVTSLLDTMEAKRMDYTTSFHRLGRSLSSEPIASELNIELADWFPRWRTQLGETAAAQALMGRENPIVIPRNHHMESVIQECTANADPQSAERFLDVLRSPYEERPHTNEYQDPPKDHDANYRTFCGT